MTSRQQVASCHGDRERERERERDIGGGALYAVYAKAYTVFLCVC